MTATGKKIKCPTCGREFDEGIECFRCGTPRLSRGEECPECCKLPMGSKHPPIHLGPAPLTRPPEPGETP